MNLAERAAVVSGWCRVRLGRGLASLKQFVRQRQEGQSIVILTGAMMGLIAFAGLVTDVSLVYVQYGHLRRAVDAAAVAAAGQMREGRSIDALVDAAEATVALHGLDAERVEVYVPPYLGGSEHYSRMCSGDLEGLLAFEDPSMCADPPRKLVRVEVSSQMHFAFMRILGFEGIVLKAMAEGEAATLDVALVLDRSWSMAWDTPWVAGMEPTGSSLACYNAAGEFDTVNCWKNTIICNQPSPNVSCEPMAQVLDSSRRFLDRLQPPFDRASLVTFDRYATTVVTMTSNLEYVLSILEGAVPTRTVTAYNDEVPCRLAGSDIWECANTNLGMGLATANNQFTHWTLRRDESVWVMILLSDGGANAALGVDEYCENDESCCPTNTRDPDFGPPYCRDEDALTRHCASVDLDDCVMGGLEVIDWPPGWSHDPPAYDADDFARDMADVVSLRPPKGNYIVTFSIGLGADVTSYEFGGDPDAGERVLRYLANVGYNGEFDTGTRDLCDPSRGVATGDDCGNYFFAPDPTGLDQIFEEIASRIFTRITR